MKHPLATDTALLTAAYCVAALLGLLNSLVAARLLGSGDYGILSLVTAYPMLLWTFVSVKTVAVTSRYIAGFRATGDLGRLQAVLKLGLLLDFLLSIISFVLVAATASLVARRVYGVPGTAWMMALYAASFPVYSVTGSCWAVLSAWQKFRWLAALVVVEKALALVAGAGLVLAGFGVSGMVVGTALAHVGIGLAMLAATCSLLHRENMGSWWRAPLAQVTDLRKELVALLGWNYLGVTLGGILTQLPVMLLGRLRGPEEAGFFRLASNLASVGSYPETSMGRVTQPAVAARWELGERQTLAQSLRRWTLRAGLPVGVLVALVVPLLPLLVPWLFGRQFEAVVPGTQVLFMAASFSAVFFWLNTFYLGSGKLDFWVKGNLVYTALFLASGGWVARQWGFLGLAVLVASGKILLTLVMCVAAVRLLRAQR